MVTTIEETAASSRAVPTERHEWVVGELARSGGRPVVHGDVEAGGDEVFRHRYTHAAESCEADTDRA